jgi:hypothetical protein
MADWPPDKYSGTLIEPALTALPSAPAPEESSSFDQICEAFDRLYSREPHLTRALLEQLRSATTEDLKRLFTS